MIGEECEIEGVHLGSDGRVPQTVAQFGSSKCVAGPYLRSTGFSSVVEQRTVVDLDMRGSVVQFL